MGLVPFGELKSYFQKLELETPGGLCSSRGIDSSVVVVGCGTSNLSADLQEVFGFRQVLSIDYSDAVISHMKARFGSCDALSFHQADLTQPCGHVVPDGTADLVVDKSTLDCLLCSEGAVGLICNISRMLRVGGLYVVISFHEAEFLVGFLSLAFTVESVTSLKRSTGADVRALSLRKTAEEGACCLRARLQSWEARRKSLLTPRRAETMEAAWLASSRTGAVDQPCLPIEEAYLAMFTDTERREYMLADFESDLAEFRPGCAGLTFLDAKDVTDVRADPGAVAATLTVVGKLEELLEKEAQTAEKGSRGINTPVGTKPVQTLLQTFVREWSAEGLQERGACFEKLLGAMEKSAKEASRVLLPASSLGRLAFDVASRGHSVEACEGRLLQWYGMELIRQHSSTEALRPQPFALNTCNRLKFSDNHRATPIPDVDVKDMLPRQRFGDFTTLYDASDAKESFDCLLSAYALDLSPNVFRFVRTAAHVLRPGGLWANFGPLAYDSDHDEGPMWRRQPDYYEVLGLARTATADDIRRAYRFLNDPSRRAAYDSGKLERQDSEPTFTTNMAHDLFRDVFGAEFARRLTEAAGHASNAVAGTIDLVAESETFKAAKRATTTGISKAAESMGNSHVVKSAVAQHLGTLTDKANSKLADKERAECLSKQALELQRRRLDEHCLKVAQEKSARGSRKMNWWESTWEWLNGDQAAADLLADKKASTETKKLQAQLLWAKTAWQKAASDLDEARWQASEAEKKELSALQQGASLQDAAEAGAFMVNSFLDRVRWGEGDSRRARRSVA
ncbi:unnamed protein product [Effrenium voratum]|uniref:carnosine N-methyltransferase n=1 Tax=Effrenium voratum TaxID=2562239 RepID=A0AA36NH80_9DINO|nr:unnamed protein product [Effrenium voratum]